MARTPGQRGRVGNWLVERRMARGWATQAQARAEVERLTGWRIPQSVYAEWESGRRIPSPENEARLAEFYGGEPEPAPADQGAVIAAIDRQTAAIEQQTRTIEKAMLTIAQMVGAVVPLGEAPPRRTRGGDPARR